MYFLHLFLSETCFHCLLREAMNFALYLFNHIFSFHPFILLLSMHDFRRSVLEVTPPIKRIGFASKLYVLYLDSKLTCDVQDKDLFAESLSQWESQYLSLWHLDEVPFSFFPF